jgi:hypothetical protein
MDKIARLTDRELDLLLAGKAPSDYGSLDDVAAFVGEVATVLQETPDEATAARHLAAISAVAREEFSQPTVSPSRADRKAHCFRTRSKPVFRNPLSGLAGKMALIAVVVLAAFGGTAYAGGLPDPLQGAVADMADSLGVSLPGADNDSDDVAVNGDEDSALDDSVGNGDEGAVSDVNDGEVDSIDEDDQGNADEDDQGSAAEDDQGNADEDDQSSAAEDDQGSAAEDDQGGDAGDQTGDSGDQGGDAGDQGGDAGDQGGDAGDQSGSQGDGDN